MLNSSLVLSCKLRTAGAHIAVVEIEGALKGIPNPPAKYSRFLGKVATKALGAYNFYDHAVKLGEDWDKKDRDYGDIAGDLLEMDIDVAFIILELNPEIAIPLAVFEVLYEMNTEH